MMGVSYGTLAECAAFADCEYLLRRLQRNHDADNTAEPAEDVEGWTVLDLDWAEHYEYLSGELDLPGGETVRVEVRQDQWAESPREWMDHLGTMVYWHRREVLGDVDGSREWGSPREFIAWAQAHRVLALPLYVYDHSGLTMNCTGFTCPWDSGQVGWIYVERTKVRKAFDVKRVTKAIAERALRALYYEVHEYNDYLTGNVHVASVTVEAPVQTCAGCGHQTREVLVDEACHGYYGEVGESGALDFLNECLRDYRVRVDY